MSTEVAHQSRGGLKRHTTLRRAPTSVRGNNAGTQRNRAAVLPSSVLDEEDSRPTTTVELSSDQATTLEQLTAHIPLVCGCGCGGAINMKAVAIIELRYLGYKQAAIAERLECSIAMVKSGPRQISRYRPGHAAIAEQWPGMEERPCTACGKLVRIKIGAKTAPRCRNICIDAQEWLRLNCAEYDARQERANERARNAVEPLLQTYGVHRKVLRLARAHGWASVLGEREAKITDLVAENEELRALLAEQTKDARSYQVQFAPSLDYTIEDDDDGSLRQSSLGAVHFDREDDAWAYYAGQGTRRKRRR